MLNKSFYRMTQAAFALVLAAFLAGCQSHPPITHFSPEPQTTNSNESLVLHEGDTIHIAFPGAPKLDSTQTIRRDGKITMEPIGEIYVAGMTPHELEESLLKLYDTQLLDKEVTVSVPSSIFTIYVTGAIGHNGKLTSDRVLTPLQAVLEAGIDTTRSNLKRVMIIRTKPDGTTERFRLNLKKVLKHGEPSDPFTLKPMDIIFVPEKFSWL
jgi:protein involved in polysaccharide export with SLBB domain